MGEERPEASVIIVNWNGGAALGACVGSVAAATRGRDVEVIVVDNASTDGSSEAAAGKHAGAKLIRNSENVGFARGANRGISAAKSDVYLLLNPDAEISVEALDDLLAMVKEDGRVGIVGCGSVDAEGREAPGFEMSFPGQRGKSIAQREGKGRDVAWVSGACLATRRGMVDEIGPLDGSFFMYYEDVDWCYRARQAGWRVVTLPGVTVRHEMGTCAGQASGVERARWAAESRVRFYCKHYPRLRAAWLRMRMAASALAGMIWRALPALFSGGMREGVRSQWTALRAALSGRRDEGAEGE